MTSWPDRQRGAVTLIGALFIIITLALMVEVLQRMTSADILDTAVQNDAVAALFIAETGIEHASYLYANGTSCADLSLLNNIAAGRGDFDITVLAPVGSDCQIRVSGEITALGAKRVIDATLRNDGGNLLGDINPDFDEPDTFPCSAPGCTPTGWNLPDGGWSDNSGPTGSGDRAAYVEKPTNGPGTVTTAGSFGLTPFTVTAPATLTLEFDYKVVANGGGNSTKVTYLFSLWDGTTAYSTEFPVVDDTTSAANNFVTRTVDIDITGNGPVTITEFRFSMEAKSGQRKWGWLDNLDLQGPGGGAGVRLLQWREVVSN
jgi:hypothetical protein